MAGKYQSFDPAAEVDGYSMLSLIQCLRKEEIHPFLVRHGLTNIEPEKWYPVQKWLDVLSDLAEVRPGQAMFDFVAVGMKIMETAQFPPELAAMPFAQVVMGLAENHPTHHRNGYTGKLTCELVGYNHAKITVRAPYPDDMWYGIMYGAAKRYLPHGTSFTVFYDEAEPRREQGGEYTIVHIKWE